MAKNQNDTTASLEVKVLSFFNAIHVALLEGKKLSDIYALIGEELVKLFPNYIISIARIDSLLHKEFFEFHFENGERQYPKPQTYNNIRQQLVEAHNPILVNENAENFVNNYLGADYAEKAGIIIPKAFLFAPFVNDNEVVGYISLKHLTQESAFTPIQVHFIQALAGSISVVLQNQQNVLSAQKKYKEQAALLESMKELSQKPELEYLLRAVVERAINLLEITGGELAIYNEEKQELEVVTSLHLGMEYQGVTLALGEGVMGKVAEQRTSIIIPDYLEWEGRSDKYSNTVARSVMAAPLLLGQQLVGVICAVHLEEGRRFVDADMELLELFASVAATAIDNVTLYQSEKNSAEEQKALLATSQDLSSKLELNAVLQSVVERAVDLLQVTGGELAILDDTTEQLEIVASTNLGMESIGIKLKIGEGAMGIVAQTKEPLIIPDYQIWEGRSNKYEATKVRGVMAVPLISKEVLVGVLCTVHLENDRTFTQKDIRLLKLFAPLAATAIENAQLFNKTKTLLALTEKREQELKSTQQQLIQSEKMASLGELTAGIAHEIQNPLNFVNNFSELNNELLQELGPLDKLGVTADQQDILKDLQSNSEKINHHGQRAAAIVKGMLQHSRTSSGQKEPTDINALCDEYLRLAYHGLRAKDKNFNAEFKTEFDETIPKVNIVPQDMGRVVLNLINNAFFAVGERGKEEAISHKVEAISSEEKGIPSGLQLTPYSPTVTVSTKNLGNKIEITVSDNGTGIPNEIKEKIFQPFFTTKPTGQGTGLGLSLAYDIVTKGHGGELKVESKEREGTTFSVQLPI
ncbi:MAG: GAF domain-containing protein [Chitinophagaceae bacterium]|nr:GAF domain-containing protein [Chitinophagaceae bacterium]